MVNRIKCIIVDDEPMAREVLKTLLDDLSVIEIIATCKNVSEAFDAIDKNIIDLVFLDINLPEVSGLSFAKSINSDIKIIFTTAYREYAVDGFDLKAVDYLLKPISQNRLGQAINKYLDENVIVTKEANQNIDANSASFIFVRSDRKMVKINFDAINYIESFSDYIKIHLVGKMVITRETITNIEAKLPKTTFLRIHRSFIISLDKIEAFTNDHIEIAENLLPISRGYRKAVISKLNG